MHATVVILTLILPSLGQTGESEKPVKSADPARGAETAEALFRREYRHALRRIDAYFQDLTATGTLTITRIPVERARTQSSYGFLFEFAGGASKWEQTPIKVAPQDGSPVVTVWCRNPQRYVLKLSRTPGARSRFAVREILPKTLPLSDAVDGTIYRHLKASHAVNGTPFSEIMDDPSFSLRSAEYEGAGAGRLIHVKYDYAPKRQQMLRGGELWLMPDQGWAIRKCRSDYYVEDRPTTSAGMLCQVEYGALKDGVAHPRRVETEQRLGKFRIEEVFDFDKFVHGETRAGDFTLANYGLTEAIPLRTAAKSSSRMSWFLALNGMVVVSLLLIISWRRRTRMVRGDAA